jgi:hypothetical protein
MSKLRVLLFALFAVCACISIAATSGFAADEWLVEGKPITAAEGALSSETVGEVELIQYNGTGIAATVLSALLCSGIFIGTVGPGAADTVASLQNLAKEAISATPLFELALLCNVTADAGALTDCELGTGTGLLWLENLPWKTEIVLTLGVEEEEEFLDVFLAEAGKVPSWYVECRSLLGVVGTDLCEGEASADLLNEAAGVPASVLGSFLLLTDATLRYNCNLTGELTGEVVSEADGAQSGDTWAVEGGVRLATAIS